MKSDHWITTHWPVPDTDLPFSRHVYLKEWRVNVPKPGDTIFVRVSTKAEIDGKRVKRADRRHKGKRAKFDVPTGSGDIIGIATVSGPRRPIDESIDVVFDFGDLRTWDLVPCENFKPASLKLDRLLSLTGFPNPRCLNLYHIPDDRVAAKIMSALNR